jgi:ribosomal protein S18 acetylase RimI-like enzyme
MRIAPLSIAEAMPYRALMLEAYAGAPDAFTSTPEERAAEPESWWARRMADPRGMTVAFGAFTPTGLMGTVAMEYTAKPKIRHKAHLIGMYVRPQVRGTGAGRLLMEAAVSHARARPGVEVITLTVTQGNAAAEHLYRSVGFQAFGVEPMAVRGEAGYLAKIHMWLALGDAGSVA